MGGWGVTRVPWGLKEKKISWGILLMGKKQAAENNPACGDGKTFV